MFDLEKCHYDFRFDPIVDDGAMNREEAKMRQQTHTLKWKKMKLCGNVKAKHRRKYNIHILLLLSLLLVGKLKED